MIIKKQKSRKHFRDFCFLNFVVRYIVKLVIHLTTHIFVHGNKHTARLVSVGLTYVSTFFHSINNLRGSSISYAKSSLHKRGGNFSFLDSKLKFRDFYGKLEELSAALSEQIEALDALKLPKEASDRLKLIAAEMLKRD